MTKKHMAFDGQAEIESARLLGIAADKILALHRQEPYEFVHDGVTYTLARGEPTIAPDGTILDYDEHWNGALDAIFALYMAAKDQLKRDWLGL